jgi:glucose/arabinose dehydrogenase
LHSFYTGLYKNFYMPSSLKKLLLVTFPVLLTVSCQSQQTSNKKTTEAVSVQDTTKPSADNLPEPYATNSTVNFSKVTGWKDGEMPKAPEGFTVSKFAGDFNNPRWIYVADNGDIFVAECNKDDGAFKQAANVVTGRSKSVNNGKSANRITLLRDTNGDGTVDQRTTFFTGLDKPFGMLILNGYFYIAANDGLWRFPYKTGQTSLSGSGQQLLTLPKGGYNNHWTRNLLANKAGTKIYISVGSGSNAAEHGMDNEIRRANILEINPDGSGERIFASGLRNPVGMDWAPGTQTLWTVVNERDELGDELVPDYLTSVKEGGFYGWPYSYFGQHVDPRIKDQRPDLVKKAIVPDVPLGPHTASLGLRFYTGTAFPERYRNGAFIGQHGSWNKKELAGYKVVFIPFKNGKPSGQQEDFLTGFVEDEANSKVHGRPVGVAVTKDGALLVADDSGNTIWRVAANK